MHVHVLSIQLETNGYVDQCQPCPIFPSMIPRHGRDKYIHVGPMHGHRVRKKQYLLSSLHPPHFILLTHVSAKTSSTFFLLFLVLHHVNALIVLIIGL